MSHVLRRSAWCACIGAVVLGAMLPADAATKTTRKASKTTKTTKRTATTKRRVVTTRPATTKPAPTTIAAATLPPATVATTAATTIPTTTAAPTTVTSTTVAAPSFDFSLRLTQPTQRATPGSTVSFIVVAEQRGGAATPVLLFPMGMPTGVTATVDQNPILSAGEMKFVLPTALATGFYEVRINGTANNVSRSVTASILVESGPAVSTTSTSATTTTLAATTTTRPTYKYSVIVSNPSGTLSTGGSLSYPITINRDSGNNDTISLAASELPTNVWVGFSDNPVGTSSTMWVSSTLPLKAGSYKFNLVITSLGTSQSIPLTLNIV